MKDLTQGSTTRNLIAMSGPIAFGMVAQMLYYLVDLYFVAQLGKDALAGVSAAGTATFIVMGLTQAIGAGTMALISQAVGRKDQLAAKVVFNQSIMLSTICGVATLLVGYVFSHTYMAKIGADTASTQAGVTYLNWFLPGMALQFVLVTMNVTLRGTGVVKPTMIVQMASVVLNMILAPALIAGWGTGYPLGVAGAALASTIAVSVAIALLGIYFFRLERYVSFHSNLWRPQPAYCKRILSIGLPAGGEFFLMFVYAGIVYACIRGFGVEAQASFGLGSRIMQAVFLPAMAIAFAASPIIGQNFGAGRHERVRETLKVTVLLITSIMIVFTLLMQVAPSLFVRGFTNDPEVLRITAVLLQINSFNFVALGLTFTCSSVFQGLGDTRPALLSTAIRVTAFLTPTLLMSGRPDFRLEHIWYFAVATQTLQALLNLWFVRLQFRRKLNLAVYAPAA